MNQQSARLGILNVDPPYLQKPGHSLLEPLDLPVDQIVERMKMVADLSARCTRPVKHLTFSAAREDGRLDDATWLKLVDEAERELGLDRHLRVVVRHTDKGSDLFVRTIAKGGPRVDKRAPAHAPLGARPIAMFEFDTPQESNAGRGVQAVGLYRATVRPDGVAYARADQPVAFIDRGSAIEVFLDDEPDLRAATVLAVHRERVPHLLHADLEIVERVRRIADTLEKRSARSQRVTQHETGGDPAGMAMPPLTRRSVTKGPRAPIVPDGTGNGRKTGQGR